MGFVTMYSFLGPINSFAKLNLMKPIISATLKKKKKLQKNEHLREFHLLLHSQSFCLIALILSLVKSSFPSCLDQGQKDFSNIFFSIPQASNFQRAQRLFCLTLSPGSILPIYLYYINNNNYTIVIYYTKYLFFSNARIITFVVLFH